VSGVDFSYSIPAGFGQLGLRLSPVVSTSLAGRCDFHDLYGTYCTPRAAVLVRPAEGLSLRASAGLGFYAPTPITEETDAIGLRSVIFPRLQVERARSASLDGHWQHGAFEVSATLSWSRITHSVRLDSIPGDLAGRLEFVNAGGPTDTWAGELFAVYQRAPIVLTLFYGYLHGREDNAQGGRRESTLTPRHAVGADLAWEAPETGTWIALEAFYTGRQALDDDPSRTRSIPYVSAELLASQRVGPVWLFGTLDNIGNFRITRHEPILLPAPAAGGRRTITPWGPLEGRSVALGAMARF
jgi:iron complex outermembrane receptor protein